MAPVLGLAIDRMIADQTAEQVEGFGDLGMQALRDFHPPAGNPLAALQPAGTDLRLPPVTGGTAIGHAVGFQHDGLDAVHLGQVYRCGQSRIAGPDDGHIHIHVRRDWPIVLGGMTGSPDPICRRIITVRSQTGRGHRVIQRIEGHGSCAR